jgi:hypothetical protein
MASPWRQVWHQQKEVKQVACDNCNELLEKSSKHAIVWTPTGAGLMLEKQQLAASR